MSNLELEKYYEEHILHEYNLDADVDFSWRDHIKINTDTFAHYFIKEDVNYILVFEKKLNSSNSITKTHDIILPSHNAYKNSYIFIRVGPNTGYIENITGYFSLYRE